MLSLIKRFALTFLYDEHAAQRMIAVAWFAVGTVLSSGGVVPLPTGEVVIPLGEWGHKLVPIGNLMMYAAIYLGAGGKLPKLGAPPEAPSK